jgi:hypothetical protein
MGTGYARSKKDEGVGRETHCPQLIADSDRAQERQDGPIQLYYDDEDGTDGDI